MTNPTVSILALGIAAVALTACGSDGAGAGDGSGGTAGRGAVGTGATGNMPGVGGGTGNMPGVGGGTGNMPGVGGGTGNMPGVGGGTGMCTENGFGYSATKLSINISWAGNIGLQSGSGIMNVWTLSKLNFDGTTNVTGEVKPCGSSIPPFEKTPIAGGGKVQTVIPDAVWDSPGMPTFQAMGTISDFGPNAQIMMQPVTSLVGLSMANPAADPWPSDWKQIQAVDPEGNGAPGIVANPRTDGEFGAPPTSIAQNKFADQLGLVTRTEFQLTGTRTSCTSASGSVNVSKLDSHVVYCHIQGGGDCTDGEVGFIDGNQPQFMISGATYEMQQVGTPNDPNWPSCADVRAALP